MSPQVTVARTVEEVEALRPAWEKLHIVNIDSDIDYFLTVINVSPDVIRPHVVHINRPGMPDLFGLARLQILRFPLFVGYRAIAALRLKALVVSFGGVVAAEGDLDEASVIIGALRKSLREEEAHALVLQRLNRASACYAAAVRASHFLRIYGLPAYRQWISCAPESLDDYFGRRSCRTGQKLRRQDRRIERLYGEDLKILRFDDFGEAAKMFRDMEIVASKSYQRAFDSGFRNEALDRALIELCLRKKWFSVWILYLRGAPVAFWSGFIYQGVYRGLATAFDPTFAKDSVGTYTMHQMIEDIGSDPRISTIDMGPGDAYYKIPFGHTGAMESDVIILSIRPRAIGVGLAVSVFGVANSLGRHLAKSSDLASKAKQALRQRARSS
jgi:hypothetical protein